MSAKSRLNGRENYSTYYGLLPNSHFRRDRRCNLRKNERYSETELKLRGSANVNASSHPVNTHPVTIAKISSKPTESINAPINGLNRIGGAAIAKASVLK